MTLDRLGRADRAQQLRDALLASLASSFEWTEVGPTRFATSTVGPFRIAFRTPFTKMPAGPDPGDFQRAALKAAAIEYGYVLDLWRGTKVMSLGWNDSGPAEIITFKPGAWDAELLELLATREPSAESTSMA